jgi:hypothetical protein
MSKILNIKHLLRFLTIVLATFWMLPQDLHSQQRKTSAKKSNSEWVKNLWFGGGINLGFSSDAYNSSFQFGIAPMAGYKLNNFLSVGPRISLDFTVAKISYGPQVFNYNSTDFGIGIFMRFKFLETFFAHLEYSQLNETYGYISNNQLEKERQWRDIALLGLGYNSNSTWAYEIYISYNFLEESSSFRLPVIYRAGFTYNF